jgi:hypothetical protein
MSRLRTRTTNRLREPFGKAGLTVAILALVMALIGGAYAAGGLTKSQEKQVTKIAKKFAGKPGAPGAAGANGTNGTNGKDGAPGKEGSEGKQGPEGVPGTTGFTETLPSGKTLEGDWAVGQGSGELITGVSFAIPLETAPVPIYVKEGAVPPAECPGTVAAPLAEPGYLCVYASHEANLVSEAELGGIKNPKICSGTQNLSCSCALNLNPAKADPSGFVVTAVAEAGGYALGTWAVTAE